MLRRAQAFGRTNLENLQVLSRQIVTRLELYATGHTQENVVRSRQRSEQALTVERNFVAGVLNTISALVLVFDTAGRIVRFNRACEVISGYTFGDLAGRSFPEELRSTGRPRDGHAHLRAGARRQREPNLMKSTGIPSQERCGALPGLPHP